MGSPTYRRGVREQEPSPKGEGCIHCRSLRVPDEKASTHKRRNLQKVKDIYIRTEEKAGVYARQAKE
jgi:hypothetical protein